MKKKVLSVLLSSMMLVPVAAGLAACGDAGDYDYNITVWVGEYTDELTREQIKAFNENTTYNPGGIKFNATVEVVSESKAAGDATKKSSSAADIFCIAENQLASVVKAGVLSTLNSNSVDKIETTCDADSVEAAKVGNIIRAFPLTADNTYFMYYDKSVITDESHLNSLEDLIADCESNNKLFAMNLGKDGGWYAASFFYATGCVSEWETNLDGSFKANYNDTFNSDNGVTALRGMEKLLKSKAYLDSSSAGQFNAGTPAAVVVSGIWDYNVAKGYLRENLGIAPLPSFYVDNPDTTYQLKAYLGHKFMCVKEQSDVYKGIYLQQLAAYLTSEECQLQRFEKVGWGPTNKEAQKNANVVASPALAVIADAPTIPQGQYPEDWWSYIDVLTLAVKDNAGNISDSTLRAKLNDYSTNIAKLV